MPNRTGAKPSVSSASAPAKPVGQCYLTADIIPQGDGTFILKPRRPEFGSLMMIDGKPSLDQWVKTSVAMKLLSIPSRGTMWAIRNSSWCRKYLVWRRTTEHRASSIVYEVQSIFALRRALQELGK